MNRSVLQSRVGWNQTSSLRPVAALCGSVHTLRLLLQTFLQTVLATNDRNIMLQLYERQRNELSEIKAPTKRFDQSFIIRSLNHKCPHNLPMMFNVD